MKVEQSENPPIIEVFFIFATYGGLLLVVLTTFFWKWSGMASLGVIYLMIVAPVLMGIITFRHSKRKNDSIYHKWIYKFASFYFLIAPIIIGGLFFVINKYLE